MKNFAFVAFLFIWLLCLNVLSSPVVTTSLEVNSLLVNVNKEDISADLQKFTWETMKWLHLFSGNSKQALIFFLNIRHTLT